jgi:hypothetical protein
MDLVESSASPVARKQTIFESPGSESSVWNDAAGVGSRGPPSKSYTAEQYKGEDLQDTDEEEFPAFDY